ncbi:MAG: hypothetical protein R3A79_01720 [Nannocystaceae bacterium]
MTKRRPHRLALAAALALGLAPTSARAAVASCPEVDRARRATLVVDTSTLEEGAAVIQERIREGLSVTLRDLEILPAKQASAPVLRVELWQHDGDFHYSFAITLERGENRRQELRHTGECDACTEGEIVGRVLEAVDGLAVDLCAATEQAEAKEAAAPPPEEPEATPPPPPQLDDAALRDDPALNEPAAPVSRPLGAAGKGGVAALCLGAAAVVVGSILAVREPTPLTDRPLYVRNTQPPGVAVASAGAGVVLTGAILLLVDRARARRPQPTNYAARQGRGGPPR